MTTPARLEAIAAYLDHLRQCDDPEDCDRESFILGYLRGRGEAHGAELKRLQAVERLVSLADGTAPGQWMTQVRMRPIGDE